MFTILKGLCFIPILKALRSAALVAVCLTALGCATLPKAETEKSSGLAISVEAGYYSNPTTMTAFLPQMIIFAKLDDPTKLVSDRLLTSNYNTRKFFRNPFSNDTGIDNFLLNLDEGCYAAIAAYGDGAILYFPEEAIRKSIVTVKPGTIVYMGKFVFDTVTFWNNASNFDETQMRYARAFADMSWANKLKRPFGTSLQKVETGEKEFLARHQGTFEGTAWAAAIANRLKELN